MPLFFLIDENPSGSFAATFLWHGRLLYYSYPCKEIAIQLSRVCH